MSDLYEKVSELRVAQSETHAIVKNLSEQINKYVIADDQRHRDLTEFRIASSKNLAEVATIVQDMKKELDITVNTSVPCLQKEIEANKTAVGLHTWFIRSILGVTFLAVLGGAVTSLAHCEISPAEEAPVARTAILNGD